MRIAIIQRLSLPMLLSSLSLFAATSAHAQTWEGNRATPSLRELVSVDATGEMAWPFGAEDVAGDGLASFQEPERSVDVRSVYAASDNLQFYLRSYVSAESEPHATLRLYVFVDADDDLTTGGSAAAPEVDAEFTDDPTSGGYDHVLGVATGGAVLGFWDYDPQANAFSANAPAAAQAAGESGVDVAPLRFGPDERGYLQVSVARALVGIDSTCGLELFVRALSDEGSDLDASVRAPCAPADSNANGVPNVVEAVDECSADADCPAGGVCIGGSCTYAAACAGDNDCAADESCTNGSCVAVGGGNCGTSADCDGLVCVSGTCQPCATSGASCAPGQTCGADGRCAEGTPGGTPGGADGAGGAEALVDPDEEVQGGAFTCGLARRRSSLPWMLGLGLLVLALGRRREG